MLADDHFSVRFARGQRPPASFGRLARPDHGARTLCRPLRPPGHSRGVGREIPCGRRGLRNVLLLPRRERVTNGSGDERVARRRSSSGEAAPSGLYASAGSRAYPQIGVSDSHHPISHHGGDRNKIAALQRINTYHVSLLGYFLDKLAATADCEGSVLDNVAILYGSAISEGNRHDSRNLPLLLAGGAGGRIEGGRHLRYPAGTQRLTNLQLTLLNTLGVPAEKFGDSTGERLGELSGVARATTG